MKKLALKDLKITKGFWKEYADLLSDEIVPYQWDALNNRIEGVPLSHAVENFRIAAGETDGDPQGTIFQDSDVAKWIEAASYSLIHKADPELEKEIDKIIELIKKSQHDNGYVNTFFTARGIDQRWTDLIQGHELYCAGHLIEAAVAYFQTTGKRVLLDVMIRYADFVDQEFGPEEGKIHSFDGHPEIELALYRLFEVTGNQKYADLADYFINIRGTVPDFYRGVAAKEGMIPESKWFRSDYYLAHRPVREMDEVTGHAVRAVYLYTGMADQYRRKQDPELLNALNRLWENLVSKRIYLTAGIGSQEHGERFTGDYDLPSDRGYTETCASIGLVFWAWRMLLINPDRKYADMIERALYNGALAGIAMDGKSYFYVNPLEVKPEFTRVRKDLEHVSPHRLGWFDCACCPTNIARLIGSVGSYAYSSREDGLYVHQYLSSEADFPFENQNVTLVQDSEMPWGGKSSFRIHLKTPSEFTLLLRQPSWCSDAGITVSGVSQDSLKKEKGYWVIHRKWTDGDLVEIHFDIKPVLIQANTKVPGIVDKIALSYGPLIYCLEEKDNGKELQEILVDPEESIAMVPGDDKNRSSLHMTFNGLRESSRNDALYSPYGRDNRKPEKIQLKAIPYYQWGNRCKDQEMRIWLKKK